MPNLLHRLTQIALALIGMLLFAFIAAPAFANYSYRGCDAEGCWRYQCDSRGENCTRTPLYGPGHRWDRPNSGDDYDRDRDYRYRNDRRWDCDRWDDDCRWDRRNRGDRWNRGRRGDWRCDRWDDDCRW